MSSCFGIRKKSGTSDREPLLPQYNDDTSLQRRIHQKLHTYQMIRAFGKGYIPSTEQVIINLRTLLASDVLNLETPGLSDSGRLLLKLSKQWISQFIEFLHNKNDDDQIQDFIWFLSHAKLSIDAADIIETTSANRTRADLSAAYESIRTVGSLLLTNSDFRLFLADLNKIGRQVFADTANTLSNVAEDAAKQVEPSAEESAAMKNRDSEPALAPSNEDLQDEILDVGNTITNGLKKTGEEAGHSLKENLTGDEGDTLRFRLSAAVRNLRKRTDYSDSVSTIGLLFQRYTKVYSRAADKTITTVQEDIDTNEELDRAIENGWALLSSFGDKRAWTELKKRFHIVMEHSQKDPEFENRMGDLAKSIQDLLSDPEFFESLSKNFDDMREKSGGVGHESPLRQDIQSFLQQARVTLDSVFNDEDVSKLMKTTLRIYGILFPTTRLTNPELLTDTYTVFVPLLVQAIQYIPIPRLEVSVPEIDLLLENLILEPGRTINNTSFLPFKLNIETHNDFSIQKARMRTVSSLTTLVTINIQGMSIRADEVGFWLRAHKGLLRLADEGIASFELDDRGIDITVDVEVGKDRLEKILSLRNVRVKIHHLNYTLRKSKFAFIAWILRPLLRPTIRKVLERQLSSAISNALHAANRELLYARERLRATRISNPNDLRTFVKAVITRLTPEENPDLYASVGVTGASNVRGNVFAGVYAPGSVVKLWNEEAVQASGTIDDHASQGWRNDIFDVQVRNMV